MLIYLVYHQIPDNKEGERNPRTIMKITQVMVKTKYSNSHRQKTAPSQKQDLLQDVSRTLKWPQRITFGN